jgi:hypothetical protein
VFRGKRHAVASNSILVKTYLCQSRQAPWFSQEGSIEYHISWGNRLLELPCRPQVHLWQRLLGGNGLGGTGLRSSALQVPANFRLRVAIYAIYEGYRMKAIGSNMGTPEDRDEGAPWLLERGMVDRDEKEPFLPDNDDSSGKRVSMEANLLGRGIVIRRYSCTHRALLICTKTLVRNSTLVAEGRMSSMRSSVMSLMGARYVG